MAKLKAELLLSESKYDEFIEELRNQHSSAIQKIQTEYAELETQKREGEDELSLQCKVLEENLNDCREIIKRNES